MQVRRARESDVEGVLKNAESFFNASPMQSTSAFDHAGFEAFFINALESEDIVFFVAVDGETVIGICAALVYPLYFAPTERIAQELFWWLDEAYRDSGLGGQLFSSIEAWAKEKNARQLFMIALEDENINLMKRIYHKKGFTPIERTFAKEL